VARIRTIKPEYWTDERVGECSVSARLLFIACWNFSDDHGGLDRSSRQLKAQAFPYDNVDCESLVQELLRAGLLIEYEVSGKKYLHIKGFRTHQKVEKPAKPRVPLYEPSPSPPRALPDNSPSGSGNSPASSGLFSGREGKGREGSVGESPPKSGSRPDEPEPHTPAVDSLEYEQAIMAKYPKGPNPPNWQGALLHARALVDAGLSTWPDLVAVTERYAAHFASGSSVNIAAHNFFDRRKGDYWQQPWDVVPANGAGHTNGRKTYADYDRDCADRLAALPGEDPGPL
jgi:hypothetical protein